MSVIQSKIATTTASTALACTFDLPVKAGNTVVAIFTTLTVPTSPTVDDNQGNGNYAIVTNDGTGTRELTMHYKPNVAASGTFTVTFHSTNSIASSLVILEIAGVTASLDNFNGTGSGTGTTVTTGSVTPTVVGTIVIAAFVHGSASNLTITPSATYTQVQENEGGATTAPIGVECQTRPLASAGTATWTISSSATYASVIASFKLRDTFPAAYAPSKRVNAAYRM
jgi:hypothetical protein